MPIRQQAINQLHNAESQMERKMTLIRPARFSWVTELVLTSRRRGQLWLSAVNFSAIQSHRAFHIDLWLATGPSTGYCPIRRLYRQVALKWVFPPGRLDPPTGFYGVPTESCRKHLSRELPPVNNQLRAASLRTRRLVPIEPAACCLQPGRCWTFGVVSR